MFREGDFYLIQAAPEKRTATIDIFGVIGDLGLWGEESVSAGQFIRELREVANYDRVDFNIYSEGGDVFDALQMYRAVIEMKAKTVSHVASLAASAASYLMLAMDEIEVAPEAAVMIHNPWLITMGDEADMLRAAAFLANGKKQILDIYERKTGADREHLSKLMDEETWMYGDEIVETGFADRVKEDLPKQRAAAKLDERVLKHMRHFPKHLKRQAPAPLSGDLAARVEKLRATG